MADGMVSHVEASLVPVTFGGCFGWLHRGTSRHGVVLCAPIAREGTWTYRAWGALASDIAAAGLPALRFDYPDTGDSLDLPITADAVDAWLESIAAAARWLRSNAGVEEVSLVGYRFGALLAAEAARAIPALRSVALLAPVHSGRAYLRELKLAAANPGHSYTAAPSPLEPGAIEVHGHLFSAATIARLATLDARHLAGNYQGEALVLADGESNAADRLVVALRAAGGRARTSGFPDASLLQGAAHEITAPEQTFSEVAAWLKGQSTGEAGVPTDGNAVTGGSLAVPAGREVPVRFSAENHLFGIHAQPEAPAAGAPAVLILNTGGNHRAGEARLGVLLARQLLPHGIASLRIDITGTGDALPLRRVPYMGLYADQAREDALAAVDWLAAASPGPCVALGLCSGAYDAFHAAVQDERISAVIAVNLQKFIWNHGDSFDVEYDVRIQHPDLYVASLGKSETWRRMLRGEIHVAKIARRLLALKLAGLRNALQMRLPDRIVVAPEMALVNGFVRRLLRRRVGLLMVVGVHDPSRNELETYFGRNGGRLAKFPTVDIRILPDVDHTFTALSSKKALFGAVLPYLKARIPGR